MEKYNYSLTDRLVFFVITPMAATISILKLFPSLIDFKNKVINVNRQLLFLILGFNLAKCILESVDLYML